MTNDYTIPTYIIIHFISYLAKNICKSKVYIDIPFKGCNSPPNLTAVGWLSNFREIYEEKTIIPTYSVLEYRLFMNTVIYSIMNGKIFVHCIEMTRGCTVYRRRV